MTPEVAVDLFREALWLTTMLVAILVVPSLICGLLVAMFQAATQINEQTLSFVPKLIVVAVSIMVFGAMILGLLSDFTAEIFSRIPDLVR